MGLSSGFDVVAVFRRPQQGPGTEAARFLFLAHHHHARGKIMKPIAIISLSLLVLLGATGTVLAQHENMTHGQDKQAPKAAPRPTPAGPRDFGQAKKPCPCDIIGTWKAQLSTTEARLYEFDGQGNVKVLKATGTAKPQEIATAKYEFVEEAVMEESTTTPPKAPDKQVAFTATGTNRIFGRTNATMKIVSYDDSSLTCEIPGVKGTVRWTRVDPERYFIVFVARQNEFYDKSGSAFPMVIKLAGGVPTIDATGTYSDHGKAAFGGVPAEVYKDYLRDAHGDSEVILRLEINSRQYARALQLVQEWQKRASEHALLYRPPDSNVALNNLLLLRSVAETLNLCQNDVDLYKLDYTYPGDWISDTYGPEFIPFYFFKELRKRNEARHIEYKKFQELVPLPNLASR